MAPELQMVFARVQQGERSALEELVRPYCTLRSAVVRRSIVAASAAATHCNRRPW
jgi:hypothetical protein